MNAQIRSCCGTTDGADHRDCPATGTNQYGVPLCVCGNDVCVHPWEPGEACSPRRALPPLWRDRHGDLWMLGTDGRLHAHETQPFTREHVEKKWGPLTRIETAGVAS